MVDVLEVGAKLEDCPCCEEEEDQAREDVRPEFRRRHGRCERGNNGSYGVTG